jgi:hypothetical protein
MVLKTQEFSWFYPENFLVILRSLLENIIGSPRSFLITFKNREVIFLYIFFYKFVFHKDMIFLSLQNQGKTYTESMKQFNLQMPDWQNMDWKSPVNTISALSILGGLLYIVYPDIVIYGAIWSAPVGFF